MAELAKVAAGDRQADPRGAARDAADRRRHDRSERAAPGAAVLRGGRVTGLALTKLDGTAKGGIALAIAHELGIPVKLIGSASSSRICGRSTPPSSPARCPEPRFARTRRSPRRANPPARDDMDRLGVVACGFGVGERQYRASRGTSLNAEAMFDSLAEKLQATLSEVRGRGTLTEDDITPRCARSASRCSRPTSTSRSSRASPRRSRSGRSAPTSSASSTRASRSSRSSPTS